MIFLDLMDLLYMCSDEHPTALQEYLDPILPNWLGLFSRILESPTESFQLKQKVIEVNILTSV